MVETNWNVDIENESVINDLIVEYLIESDEFQKVFFSNRDENSLTSILRVLYCKGNRRFSSVGRARHS